MNYETAGDAARWYAVHTPPKQEDRANDNLMAWGVQTFSPKVKENRPNPYTGRPFYIIKAVFPRYIFARFDVYSTLRKVLFTRGVRSVVSFGGAPVQVDDEVITLIQSRVEEGGFVKVEEELRTGDKVVIENGPLKNLAGVFERAVKGSDRVLILLAAITFQGSVVVEREYVGRAKVS